MLHKRKLKQNTQDRIIYNIVFYIIFCRIDLRVVELTEMSELSEQLIRETEAKKAIFEGLPMETSSSLNYNNDFEDCKRKGYGTEAHFPVANPHQAGGGGTDLSPSLSHSHQAEATASVDAANRQHQGIPSN